MDTSTSQLRNGRRVEDHRGKPPSSLARFRVDRRQTYSDDLRLLEQSSRAARSELPYPPRSS